MKNVFLITAMVSVLWISSCCGSSCGTEETKLDSLRQDSLMKDSILKAKDAASLLDSLNNDSIKQAEINNKNN